MRQLILLILATVLFSCQQTASPEKEPVFEVLGKDKTGIHFQNNLSPSLALNVFNYMYFYNGGGVSIGDFNRDSLPDIFFTGNQVPNALYLNKGNLQFEDVTKQAGVSGQDGWTTGVTVTDINQDGMLDLYVCQVGKYRELTGHNQLYVCKSIRDGIPVFEEESAKYGLDDVGFSTQAGFFDYDLDGDLDLFLLRHSLHQNGTFGQRFTFTDPHDLSGDRLYRNDDGVFKNVTEEAGILSTVIGYGLGIAFSDLNLDGWPDIYIGNDFHENDYLYINQQDGTFRDVLIEQINHTSRFSMGVDIADINNDGFNEIISLDMLPYDPFILKSSLGEDSYGIFQFKLGYGYNHQYARNNLQLNNKDNTFSEIALFANVYATDWSWAPLFADLDNDGHKDLFVSNGIPRRMNDIDYVNFYSNDDIQERVSFDELEEKDLSLTEKLPRIKLPNRVFLNNGDLSYTEIGESVLNNRISFSNGAAYADLDLDGDLDIVTNNIEDEAFIYRNLSNQRENPKNHYLRFSLTGPPENKLAIGTRVICFSGTALFTAEQYLTRGYQSSVEPVLHIGSGTRQVDSVYVIWPDRTRTKLDQPSLDMVHEVKWERGMPECEVSELIRPDPDRYALTVTKDNKGIDFRHEENPFIEFHREQLIPFMVSREGPALAVGDVNGDGLEDVFLGNAKRRKSAIFLQDQTGTFTRTIEEAFHMDSIFEDVHAAFADIDGDSDLDLLVASGGNEYTIKKAPMKQRVYLNDGKGNFTSKADAFGDMGVNASCVLPCDFDQDGDTDVFIGGRSVPWAYGEVPHSYLFENDGKGNFTDVTTKMSSDLGKAGLVTDATWADLDQDGDDDLLLALEWGPVTWFENKKSRFVKHALEETNGWWHMVMPVDLDQDGDVDFVAGNLGLNSRMKASREEPVRLYVNDFDENGQVEQLLSHYLDGEELLFQNYKEVTTQMPALKKKFLYARDFAETSFKEFFDQEKFTSAEVFEAYEMRNGWFENRDNGTFLFHPFSTDIQLYPLRAAVAEDLNGDGLKDLIAGGNYYAYNIEMGRNDAGYGNIITNSRDNPLGGRTQSLKMRGQVRNISALQVKGSTYFLFAKNDDTIELLKITDSGTGYPGSDNITN